MDREKQALEITEYVKKEWKYLVSIREWKIKAIVKIIMRRYDLFDTEDLKRE